MNGSILLLPLYALIAWTGTNLSFSLYNDIPDLGSEIKVLYKANRFEETLGKIYEEVTN
jgi:hypothetical protein